MTSKNAKKRYDEVWCVIMFDLPTQSKEERKEGTSFRKMLLDLGFSMIQFSVYGKYSPTYSGHVVIERIIKENLPSQGEVRIFHLTNNQWASATRFRSQKIVSNEEKPEQILLF